MMAFLKPARFDLECDDYIQVMPINEFWSCQLQLK